MKVPFLDLKKAYAELSNELLDATDRIMRSSQYVLGEDLDRFEEEFASYCAARYCVGVASGLDALILALKAIGIGPGDEVIVPAHTFIATWIAVTHCGGIPIPVEPELGGYNINHKLIEEKITKSTKAIIVVHLYGLPADLDHIISISNRHNLFLIEDAAQAHGASYKGKKIGSHGNAVAWSFYPGKNLGAYGDGGAVTTNSSGLAEKIKLLRNYGSRNKYQNDCIGINSRLDNLQAAYLQIKLKKLDAWNLARKRVAENYIYELNSLESDGLLLPKSSAGVTSSWHLFVVQLPRRDKIIQALRDKGIDAQIHYPIPPHLQNAYSHMKIMRNELSLTERYANSVLSLPIGPHMCDAQVEYVIHTVHSIMRSC